MGVSVEIVVFSAFSLRVPTRVVCCMTFDRSVPIEMVTVILPGANTGASII